MRKIDLGLFASKSNDNQSEYSLMCLTNLGDASIFSLSDFKRKYQNHFLKKEDINGITSLLFTKFGEGFYLRSSSEYQRFSLSSKRTKFPECFIQLPEQGLPTVEVHESATTTAESSDHTEGEQAAAIESPLDLDSSHSTSSHNQSNLNSTIESVINHIE